MSTAIMREVVQEMERLPNDAQQQVLVFLRKLTPRAPRGVPGKKLLRFAGTISPEDLHIMQQVIEENCSRVDGNEW